MKKLLSIFVMLAILMNFAVLPAFAADPMSLTVSQQTAKPGDQVQVTIFVANNPGLASLKFDVAYDSVLTLTNVTFNSAFGAMVTAPTPYKNPEPLTMISPLMDISANGVFATLTFTVANNTAYGHKADITISYNANDIYDGNYENVDVTVINGSVTIACPHANTTDVPEAPADCDEGGYTAGVFCNDCQTYISGHEPIPETGDHTDADGQWESNEVNHFRTCACGHIFDTAAHSGGTATCKEKAKCSVCGTEYGQLNAANHAGGTTVVNASEPDHKEQVGGYTGDIKCLGCNEIITYGQTIAPGSHTPADVWSNDEVYHWKECNVVGCGIVIDGSKAAHTSTGYNVATCEKQAVCDVCGVSYGNVAPHNYTAEDKKQDAMKSEGNCRDHAVYYYSCSVCGLVEHNDNHTFLGDKVSAVHVGGTTIVNAMAANHKNQVDGYTGDTKCLGCNTIVAYGQMIPAGAHTPSNGWITDGTYHWKVCTVENCDQIIEGSKTEHIATGENIATCMTKAICDICDTAYGAMNTENHSGGTAIVNACEPNHKTQTDGYTGDTQCLGCSNIIAYGQLISVNAHIPADVWSSDEIHHWKECNVVGCGVVIDGSKAPHISEKSENKATCLKQAVCDVCGVSYGSVAEHNYTAEDKKQAALKTEGNCRDNAVYYYSCSVCGLVESDDSHTFLGDKVAVSHVGGTTVVNALEADHKTQTDGYSGDTKCLGCNTIVAYGQKIAAGEHKPSNDWITDGVYHWKECTVAGCAVEIDGTKAAHASHGENVATCQKHAICDVCSASYGAVAEHDFANILSNDANGHWYACQTAGCDEKNGFAQHTPDHDGGATEEYPIKCTICHYEMEAQLEHTHVFNREVVDIRYEASKATCSAAATYFYSCKCGEKGSATFVYGEPNEHTEGTSWKSDGTYHWKECTIVGCGAVIDGSKTTHTSTGANVATCQKQAVCDICGVSHGVVTDHDFAETLSKDATGHWYACQTTGCTMKGEFAQHTPDHDGGASEEYPVLCLVCKYEIYAQLDHVHIFNKEVATEQYLLSVATCTEPAKYYKSCKCGEKGTESFTFGENLGHTENDVWEHDATGHWHYCTVAGCGVVIDTSKAEHTPDREFATVTDPIKCSVCGYEMVPALDNENPPTGDNGLMTLWIMLLCFGACGITGIAMSYKREKHLE